MANALCASPIKARVLRVVKLDTCGVPVTGAGSVVVSKGFTRVAPSPQYSEGDEITVKNAWGELCVDEKSANQLRRVDLAADFCVVNPEVARIVAGVRVLNAAGPPVTGTGFAVGDALIEVRFSLEVWQKVAGQACAAGVEQWAYWAFPNVGNSKIGNLVFENGPVTFTLTGDTKAAALEWGNGPGAGTSWLPAGEVVAAGEHWLYNVTTEPPPIDACNSAAL